VCVFSAYIFLGVVVLGETCLQSVPMNSAHYLTLSKLLMKSSIRSSEIREQPRMMLIAVQKY